MFAGAFFSEFWKNIFQVDVSAGTKKTARRRFFLSGDSEALICAR
jgi:hypothetical protein